MDLTLLSGVVRHRKMGATSARSFPMLAEEGDDINTTHGTTQSLWIRLSQYCKHNPILRKVALRVHKFTFQWDLCLHLAVCIFSLAPYAFSGSRLYSIVPISIWIFYNMLFLLGPRHSNLVIPGFGKFKHSFKATIEDFFSPRLLPVLSISFLLVVLSLTVTGHRLGGPPLCFQKCGQCLRRWDASIPLILDAGNVMSENIVNGNVNSVRNLLNGASEDISDSSFSNYDQSNRYYHRLMADESGGQFKNVNMQLVGCGHVNGKELLGYYTMAQTSFLLFLTVLIGMAVCLAWRIAEEEKEEQTTAEEWLQTQDSKAFEMRNELIKQFGRPASAIRPEGSAVWVIYGINAALTFTLLGWHNWYVLPASNTATLMIVLNLLTILSSTLILHISFFGRLLALYKRNYLRVLNLTEILQRTDLEDIDSWWNCRSFVLNEDLSLDYDIGGLAVSATFLMGLAVFFILLNQTFYEGHQAMLEAPGSYCAYACLYITCCLIKLFTLATNTYEEQHQHINALQSLSNKLTFRTFLSNRIDVESPMPQDTVAQAAPQWVVSEDDYSNLQDDGPIDIDEELNQEDSPNNNSEETVSPKNSDKPKEDSVLPKNDNNNSGFSSYFNFPLSINNFISRSRTTSYDDRANNPTETKIDEQELLLSEEKIASLAINIEEINSNNKNNAVTALSLGKIPIRNSSKVRLANSTSMSGRSVRSPKVRKGIKTLGSFNTTAGSTAYGNRVSNEDTSFKNTNDSMKESDKMSDIETGDDCSSNGTSAPPSISPNNVGVIDKDNKLSIQNPASLGKLPLVRGSSATAEAQGQAIADIISQIRKYDPYPCILGIPVMPALFSTCKFYIFICFVLIGSRTMVTCLRVIVES